MVKTNRSTLRTVYNIQQSATQGSNDTANILSRRTVTTRFSKERGRLPETDGAESCQQSNQVGLYLIGIHQTAPPEHT